MQNETTKIKCPVCRNCLLFKVEDTLKGGNIEGKCSWCNSTTEYDTDSKETKVTAVGQKAQRMKERIATTK